eukprot:7074289-Prymnesium_polylepis.4
MRTSSVVTGTRAGSKLRAKRFMLIDGSDWPALSQARPPAAPATTPRGAHIPLFFCMIVSRPCGPSRSSQQKLRKLTVTESQSVQSRR